MMERIVRQNQRRTIQPLSWIAHTSDGIDNVKEIK
jgi:hypothetical protein